MSGNGDTLRESSSDDFEALLEAGIRHGIAAQGPGARTPPTAAEPGRTGSTTSAPGTPDAATGILVLGERYELGPEIGRGGMGVVYQAKDRALGRMVAVKVLRKDARLSEERLQRFVEEAQISGQLQHPGIVPVHDLGVPPEGRPYFVMKLVRGETLKARLAARPGHAHDRLRFVSIFHQVCEAVAFAHARGVLHRDLKPSNVMLGDFGEVHVMDWGLAKVVGGAELPTSAGEADPIRTVRSGPAGWSSLGGAVFGTPAYMPPEQARGEGAHADARADVFSLGAILCEILTGHPPYGGDATADVHGLARSGATDGALRRLEAAEADPALAALAAECLAADPALRPAHAGIVAGRVATHLASAEERARQAAARALAERARALRERGMRRTTIWLSAAIAATVLAGTVVAFWLAGQRESLEREAAFTASRAMDRAEDLRARAPDGGADSIALLEQAVAALAAAEPLVRGRLQGTEIESRFEPLRAAVAAELERAQTREGRARRDRAMAERLREIRALRGVHLDYGEHDRQYAEAFREFGADVDGNTEEAAQVLERASIRPELVGALDWWIVARSRAEDAPAKGAQRLADLSTRLDPDPARCEIRTAVLAKDAGRLVRIAASRGGPALPRGTALLLAESMGEVVSAREAAGRYAGLVDEDPTDFWAQFGLACWLLRVRPARADEARAHFTAALALVPRNVVSRLNIAKLDLDAGHLELAGRNFDEALAQHPEFPMVHVARARLFVVRGDLASAEASLREALRLDARMPVAWHDLGTALGALARHEEALAAYEQALRLAPHYEVARVHRIVALFRLGRVEDADGDARELGTTPMGNVDAMLNLATYFTERKDLDRAAAAIARTLAAAPELPEAHIEHGNVLLRQGDRAGSLAAYRMAIRLDPNDARAQTNAGLVLQLLGRPAEALGYLQAAQALDVRHRILNPPIEGLIEACRTEIGLDERLARTLRGWHRPADEDEWEDLAKLCAKRDWPASEAAIWRLGFDADPRAPWDAIDRIRAACVSIRTGFGRGRDPVPLEGGARDEARANARRWLADQLDRWQVRFAPAERRDLAFVLETAELDPVRAAAQIEKLPADERQAWKELWAGFEALADEHLR